MSRSETGWKSSKEEGRKKADRIKARKAEKVAEEVQQIKSDKEASGFPLWPFLKSQREKISGT